MQLLVIKGILAIWTEMRLWHFQLFIQHLFPSFVYLLDSFLVGVRLPPIGLCYSHSFLPTHAGVAWGLELSPPLNPTVTFYMIVIVRIMLHSVRMALRSAVNTLGVIRNGERMGCYYG